MNAQEKYAMKNRTIIEPKSFSRRLRMNGRFEFFTLKSLQTVLVTGILLYALDARAQELITDRNLQRGVKAKGLVPTTVVMGFMQFTTTNGVPFWDMAEWHSQQTIYGTAPVVRPSGAYRWSNAYKHVTLGPTGTGDSDMILYVDSIAEYGGTYRTSGQNWPHLLVGQNISSPGGGAAAYAPWLSDMAELRFNIEARLNSATNRYVSGYKSSLHAAEFVIYFTVQYLRLGQTGYGDYLWFGLKLYDDRYAKPGLYANWDGGTSKYIYNIGIPFTDTGMTVGNWKTLSGNLLPYIKTAFTAARAAGALPNSGNLADYKIGGMNMGWEVTGQSRVEMQVKNFSLAAVQTDRSLIVTTPYGNASPSGINTYPGGTALTAKLAGSPVVSGTTQYVCRGWAGTGNVPASGTATNTSSFTLTTNSTVTWLWNTNYWLNTEAAPGGSVNSSDGWKTNGANVQIVATANPYYHFTGWSGDTTGNTNNAQITLTMDQARSVTANFASYENSLPFIETFEGIAPGNSILVLGNTNGWYSGTNTTSATITNNSYAWSDVLHPVKNATHTNVLQYSADDLTVRFKTNASPANTTADFMLFNPNRTETVPDSSLVAGHQTAFYVNTVGSLNVWYGLDNTGTNNAWMAYTNALIGTSDWTRITFTFDYTTDVQNGCHYFKVRSNGIELRPAANGYSRRAYAFNANSTGAWLLVANPSPARLQSFSLSGSGMLDDLVVTTNPVTDFFPQISSYILTGSAIGNGTVSPGSTNVLSGSSADFVITAANYYRITSLTTNGAPVTGITLNNDSTATNFIWSNVQFTGTLAAVFIEQVTDNPESTPYWWLAQYGLTNFNADAVADTDLDGHKNWQEYSAGTDPTDLDSRFELSGTHTTNSGLGMSVSSMAGRVYQIEHRDSLLNGDWLPLGDEVRGTGAPLVFEFPTDASGCFYRVKVRMAE